MAWRRDALSAREKCRKHDHERPKRRVSWCLPASASRFPGAKHRRWLPDLFPLLIVGLRQQEQHARAVLYVCLLYTSDAADEEDSVDLGGRRIIKKKKI